MCRNVSDDGNLFKEAKLFMHSSRGNHGYVTKIDMTYAKQIILEISQNQKKAFYKIKFFLGTSLHYFQLWCHNPNTTNVTGYKP